MKKILLSATLTIFLSFFFFQNNYAQDQWVQGRKGIYSVGLGGTQLIYLGSSFGGVFGAGRTANIGLAINASGEYKVWKFIGVGFQTGLDIMWGTWTNLFVVGNSTGFGIPIVVKGNVHILDAANVSIADKLDVYAGINFGGGPIFFTDGGGTHGFIHVGPQAGVKYWFNPKIAIFSEFGWGATFANVGVSF